MTCQCSLKLKGSTGKSLAPPNLHTSVNSLHTYSMCTCAAVCCSVTWPNMSKGRLIIVLSPWQRVRQSPPITHSSTTVPGAELTELKTPHTSSTLPSTFGRNYWKKNSYAELDCSLSPIDEVRLEEERGLDWLMSKSKDSCYWTQHSHCFLWHNAKKIHFSPFAPSQCKIMAGIFNNFLAKGRAQPKKGAFYSFTTQTMSFKILSCPSLWFIESEICIFGGPLERSRNKLPP